VKSNDTLAIILGGGQGSRLFPLTATRSKPAVPIGGKYRLIDVPISGCLHADIRRIFVLTQFNSASLNRHISGTYRLDRFSGGFVEILAAEQTPDNPNWYQGTADAVRQAVRHFTQHDADYELVLAGDHLYRMDYARMAAFHNTLWYDVGVFHRGRLWDIMCEIDETLGSQNSWERYGGWLVAPPSGAGAGRGRAAPRRAGCRR